MLLLLNAFSLMLLDRGVNHVRFGIAAAVLLLLNAFSLMLLDRGVNHVRSWGRSCSFLVT